MKRPFALAGFAFYFTLAALNFTTGTLPAFILCALALAGILSCLLLFKARLLKRLFSALIICGSVFLSSLAYAGATIWLYSPDATLAGRTLSVRALIDGEIKEGEGFLILPLKIESAVDTESKETFSLRGRLSSVVADIQTLKPYDRIECTVKLSAFEDTGTLRYNRSRGVYVGAEIKGQPVVVSSGKLPLRAVFYRARSAVRAALDARLPGDYGALVKGVVMGDKQGLPAKISDDFRRAGLSHTLAVSGLHITLFSGALMLLLTSLGLGRRPVYAVCAALPFAVAGVAGFAASAMRAALMGGLYFAGKVIDEEADGLNSLGLSLFILTAFSPFFAYDAGLMLSALATLGLILLSGRLGAAIGRALPEKARRRAVLRGAVAAVCCSVSATLFTLPASILYFGAFSPSGIAANLLAWPFVNLTFFCGVLTAALYYVYPLSVAFAAAAELSAGIMTNIASLFSAAPFSYIYVDRPHILLSLVFAALAGGAALAFRGKNRRVRPVIAASLAVMVFCSAVAGQVLATRDQLTLVAVDVGNGDCFAAIKNRCAVVFDCGGASGASDRLMNALRANNVAAVRAVVVSHTHRDHAEGIDELLRAYRTDAVFLPAAETDRYRMDIEKAAFETGANLITVENDMTVTLMDGLILRLLTDYRKLGGIDRDESNENCMVALLSYRNFDCLFTGDIGFAQERLLEGYGSLLDVEVLKVAHHGSKYSTGEAFLMQTTPLTALVSVGKNSYGHPSAEALARLTAFGGGIYRCDQCGDITVRTDGRRDYRITAEKGKIS